jgi:hypothetical protein
MRSLAGVGGVLWCEVWCWMGCDVKFGGDGGMVELCLYCVMVE